MRDAVRETFTPGRLFNNALNTQQALDRHTHQAAQHSADRSLRRAHVSTTLNFDESSVTCSESVKEGSGGPPAVLLDERIVRRIENFSKIAHLVPDLEQLFCYCSLSMVDGLLGGCLTPLKMLCLPYRVDRRDIMMVIFTAVGVFTFYWLTESGNASVLYASMYHSVRTAATIKLFLLFSILEVSDKLLTSFTGDALEVLYACWPIWWGKWARRNHAMTSSATTSPSAFSHLPLVSGWVVMGSFVCSCVGVALHSFVLLLQVVTLNVAINSEGNSLMALLISNNFAEVKAVVFKKFVPETLFQVCCSDALERVQLVLFVACILAQQLQSGRQWDVDTTDLIVVMVGEIVIDVVKHYFVATFNGISLSLYREFVQATLFDIAADGFLWSLGAKLEVARDHTSSTKGSGATNDNKIDKQTTQQRLTAPLDTLVSNPSRRCGFVPMPYLAVVIWCMSPLFQQAYNEARYSSIALAALLIVAMKGCVHEYLQGSAMRYVVRNGLFLAAAPPASPHRGFASLAVRRASCVDFPLTGPNGVEPVKLQQQHPPITPSEPSEPSLRRIASAHVTMGVDGTPSSDRKAVRCENGPHFFIRASKLLTQLVQVERFDLSAGKNKDAACK